MNVWYASLNRPPLTPPAAVFGPVWTVLYIMIAAAVILWFRAAEKKQPYCTIRLLGLHLLANFAWIPLFFGFKSPGWAFADLCLMLVTLLLLLRVFQRESRISFFLLLPYTAWVTFAGYLNLGFWFLNS